MASEQPSQTPSGLKGSCQCAAITFTTPSPTPTKLFHCHCHACRKQSGSAFGTSAIMPFFTLDPSNPHLSHFTRQCESGRWQHCYFCNKCGCRILHAHFRPDDPEWKPTGVAVKGGTLEGLKWEGAAHIFTGCAVVGVPEGVENWEAEPGWGK